jgi:hypothetical protein
MGRSFATSLGEAQGNLYCKAGVSVTSAGREMGRLFKGLELEKRGSFHGVMP